MCFTTKKYGNITCVNHGLFFYGPHTGFLLFAVSLIVIFSALGWGLGSPHVAATVIGGVWGLVSLCFLLCTALSDPGIVGVSKNKNTPTTNKGEGKEQPRHNIKEYRNDGDVKPTAIDVDDYKSPSDKDKEISVQCTDPNNNLNVVTKTMPLKWCKTCLIQRPLRASHCRYCDCCIDRFDHHCCWTGTCIGSRNYKYFFGFILSTCFYGLFMIAMMSWSMKLGYDFGIAAGKTGADAFFYGLDEQYHFMPLICIVEVIPVLIHIGRMVPYHIWLTTSDLTNREDLKEFYKDLRSPFHRGSWSENCGGVLCGDQIESIVDTLENDDDDVPTSPVLVIHQDENKTNNNAVVGVSSEEQQKQL